jgi:hypothetical protein
MEAISPSFRDLAMVEPRTGERLDHPIELVHLS